MELTREEYLHMRAVGKSKQEIAETFGWFPHVLRKQLSAWGLRSAAQETAALEPLRHRDVLSFVEQAPRMLRKPREEPNVSTAKSQETTPSPVRIQAHCPRCDTSHGLVLAPLTNGGLCEWWALCENMQQPVLVELKPTLL